MVDTYAVTDAERHEYGEFCSEAFGRLMGQSSPPSVLWYYTTTSTFAQILDSASVWATQISCLNDHSEFRYSVELFRKKIQDYFNDSDGDIQWLAKRVDTLLAENDGADTSWFFVFCTSSKKDDLSQWRAYGGGEGGISVGFDPGGLAELKALAGSWIIPVKYKKSEHEQIVREIVAATLHFYKLGLKNRPKATREAWAESFLQVWRDHVVYFAPMLKSEAFAAEDEWRIICSLRPDQVCKIKIKERAALISRHLPLEIGNTLPIREVIVGPCRNPGVSRVSVGTYLTAKGYTVNDAIEHAQNKVTVCSSRIPFQTM